jgi:uncharacterized membrane protein YjjP (DUF1212 family)
VPSVLRFCTVIKNFNDASKKRMCVCGMQRKVEQSRDLHSVAKVQFSLVQRVNDVETGLNIALRSTGEIQRRGDRWPEALTYQQALYAVD